jgi:hypothetical protein
LVYLVFEIFPTPYYTLQLKKVKTFENTYFSHNNSVIINLSKKIFNMAEKKKEKSGGGDGYSVMWEAIGFIIILLLVAEVVTNLGSEPQLDTTKPANYSSSEVEKSTFKLSNLLPHDKLALGKKIVSVGDIKVRNAPAGEIIGDQSSYAFGKIKEMEIDNFLKKYTGENSIQLQFCKKEEEEIYKKNNNIGINSEIFNLEKKL